jgi:hypothetical protein
LIIDSDLIGYIQTETDIIRIKETESFISSCIIKPMVDEESRCPIFASILDDQFIPHLMGIGTKQISTFDLTGALTEVPACRGKGECIYAQGREGNSQRRDGLIGQPVYHHVGKNLGVILHRVENAELLRLFLTVANRPDIPVLHFPGRRHPLRQKVGG